MSDDDAIGLNLRGGGSLRVSRTELDRVRTQVELAEHWLTGLASPVGLLAHSTSAVLLGLELPRILTRIAAIKKGCIMAAEHYFGTEHALANQINAVGRINVPALADITLGAGESLGLLKESGVEISRTGFAGAIAAPHSAVELALRLQQTSGDVSASDAAEFRIDRFGHHVIVYIPGTAEWSPTAGQNPLDLTSNVHAIAGQSGGNVEPAASERSVLAALRSAKVGAGDQVLLVGHSQGGIIAANIAARHNPFVVAGIVTFGSPIAAAAMPAATNVLAFEHTNDPVPMLDGGPNAIRENWLTVRERHEIRAGESPIAVHDLAGYIETAGRFDASRSVRANAAHEFLREFAGRSAGKTEWYAAMRVP